MKIAMIGCGVVGENTAKVLEARGHEVARRDPPRGLDDSIEDAELLLFSVPTTDCQHQILWDAVDQATKDNPHGTLVIRSTVIPGTTDKILEKHNRPTVFMPEFLREAHALWDAARPDKLVIGTHNRDWASKVLEVFGQFVTQDKILIMKPTEAELAKIALNSLALVKVVFANELYDLATVLGADYGPILDVFHLDQNINARHLDPLHGKKRGARGKCLPINTEILVCAASQHGVEMGLTSTAAWLNDLIREGVVRGRSGIGWS